MLTLAALGVAVPVTAGIAAAAVVAGAVRKRHKPAKVSRGKTVIVGGGKMTKALQLARSFNDAGHRVILTESAPYWMTAHRFSSAVHRFAIVPEPEDEAYAAALAELARDEEADLFVPVSSPVGSLFDAQAAAHLPTRCKTFHVAADTIGKLDDKHQFAETAAALGLAAPKSVRITDPAQVASYDFSGETRQFILKSIRYDPVRRLDLTKLPLASAKKTAAYANSLPISRDNPWVMQEFIPGTEYCTHGAFRDGALTVHACCESSAFQVNYAHLDIPEIEAWVRRYGAALELTGQASFDFIRAADDGRYYAIECNPRTHSAITMFHDHPGLAGAYLGDDKVGKTVVPLPSSRPTYWLAHEVWQLLRAFPSVDAMRARLAGIAHGKDAVLDARDPLPFLMLHHWHIPLLLLRALATGRDWLRIDFNIGKLVQAGGD
ncbi:MAG: hypothetical protein WA954_04860 [Parerythrobacter sp.]